MSIVRQQLSSFITSAIQNILRNSKKIPTRGHIFDMVDNHINTFGITLGEPTFKALEQFQYQPSNPFAHNINVDTARFDFDTYSDESVEQSLRLLRNFNASYILNRRLLSEINGLIFDIESTKDLSLGYRYVVSDGFSNADLVDQVRSTTILDLSTGKIRLPFGSPRVADLSFLKGVIEPYVLRFDKQLLRKVIAPGSNFGSIMDATDSYWAVHAHLGNDGPLSMSFQLPISSDGSRIKVNGLHIDPVISKGCTIVVEWREGLTWNVAVREFVEEKNTIVFDSVITDTLRITMIKDSSDRRLGNNYVYEYGIRSLAVFMAITQMNGEFYSKSLKLAPGLDQDATAVSVDLRVDHTIPPGTGIEYYVAIDPYVSGTFYPSGMYTLAGVSPYDYGTTGLQFSPDASGNFVLNSVVRDFQLTNYQATWIPDWKKIEPTAIDGSLVGKPVLLDYATKIQKENSGFGFIAQLDSFGKYSNVDLLKVYEVKNDFQSGARPVPTNIKLRAGKGCFIFEERFVAYNEVLLGSGRIVNGKLLVPGTATSSVVPGSIKELRPWGESESTTVFLEREDFVVRYGVPDFYSAEIASTGGKMSVVGTEELEVRFSYSVRRVQPVFSLTTSFYYDSNQSAESRESLNTPPSLTLTWWNKSNLGNISACTLYNYDDKGVLVGSVSESKKADGTVVKFDLASIGQGKGLYVLKMDLEIVPELFSYRIYNSYFDQSIPGVISSMPLSFRIFQDPTLHPDGVTAWLTERTAYRNAVRLDNEQNTATLKNLFDSLGLSNRVGLPDFLVIYAWPNDMVRVSEDHLKYRTHKYDHTKYCVIRQNDGYYAILTNNIGQFQRNSRLIKDGKPLDKEIGIIGMDASDFFDIEYYYSSGRFDSLLLKAHLKAIGTATPEIRSYSLRVIG